MLLCGSFHVKASIIDGTIDPTNHNAQTCENILCTITSTSPINFGYFTDPASLPATSNVHVKDTELTGFIWGKSFGYVVLNCADTVVTPGGAPHSGLGCVSTNGSFKVQNNYNGILSGWAWGQTTGWVNFNSKVNCDVDNNGFIDSNDMCDGDNTTTTYHDFNVTINSSGQFTGYAWAQNFGYIKFDCTSGVDYCVQTDWRPRNTRPQCSNGIDDDADGTIDSADPGCITNGVYDPTDDTESNGGSTGGGFAQCADGIDNDLDGYIDYPADPGCTSLTDNDETNGPGGPTVCTDPRATNVGQPLPCTYPSNLCSDPNATNMGQPLPCTYPSTTLCLDHSANNYGLPAPCTYPQVCTGPNCNPTDGGGGSCLLHPWTPECIDPILKIIGPTGLFVGLTYSLATSLFATPLTFSEILLIPMRLWTLLLAILGLRKRNRPWGTVYDSVTKQPLDPAYVVLQDLQGNEIATCITDLDGRYGFLVPAEGQYRIVANKTNYAFPSKKLAGKTSDEMYQDLYFGEVITIKEGEVITKNIPMDAINFDWNEFAKRDQKLMKFYSRTDVWIARISNLLFYIGFFVTTVAVWVTPTVYNVVIFILYIIIFCLKRTVLKPRPFGKLVYRSGNTPVSFAIIRVYAVGTDREVIKKVSDRTGRYYCLVPNGAYYVKIEKKNEDQSYTPIYTSSPFEVTKGFIRKKFEI